MRDETRRGRKPFPTAAGFASNLVFDGLGYLTDTVGFERWTPWTPAIKLPTRVVEVGDPDQNVPCRLYISNNRSAPYVALSHCWGDPSTVSKTTMKSITAAQVQLPERNLSKTYRDAIRITREIGIHFLWIDSLCIIQDSPEDWAREAANMGQIYRGAHLTIAAVSSTDGTIGCLNERRSRTDVFMRTGKEYFDAELYAYVRHFHYFPRQLEKGTPIPGPFQAYKLSSRKWCFQERMLSRRIIHYTSEELVWECTEQIECERGRGATFHTSEAKERAEDERDRRLEVPSAKNRFNSLCNGNSPTLAFDCYLSLAREYAMRNITFEKDVLTAFSAIARAFATAGFGDYYAGLWSSKLLHMLC